MYVSLAGGGLVLVLAVCAYTDLTARRIPNWATYSAALWALLLNAAHDLRLTAWLATPEELGAIGLGQSLVGAGICFATLFLVYSLAGGGAGDVKLAAAIGAFLGAEKGLWAIGLTYLLAGLATVGWTIWRIGPIKLGHTFMRRAGKVFLSNCVAATTPDEQALLASPVPLAGFFALGTLLVMCDVIPY